MSSSGASHSSENNRSGQIPIALSANAATSNAIQAVHRERSMGAGRAYSKPQLKQGKEASHSRVPSTAGNTVANGSVACQKYCQGSSVLAPT